LCLLLIKCNPICCRHNSFIWLNRLQQLLPPSWLVVNCRTSHDKCVATAFLTKVFHAFPLFQNAERRGNLFCTGPSLSWLVSGFNYAEAADVLLGSCHPGRDVLIFYAFISSICVGGPHPLGLGLEGSGVCCVWRDN